MSFLVLMLYYHYVRCNYWGKLNEGHWNFQYYFATPCESVRIFKNSFEITLIEPQR